MGRTHRISAPREAWLYWPDGVAGITDAPAARTVFWNLKTFPISSPEAIQVVLPKVPSGHWWSALRNVPSSIVVPVGATQGEKFLFYDGPVPFTPRWRMRGPSFEPIPELADETSFAWVSKGETFERVIAENGHVVSRTPLSDVSGANASVRDELIRRGLSDAEADSLLRTWDNELFVSKKKRAIWLLPRAAYDQMLPLHVEPPPQNIVRVGVVIEELP